MLQEPDADVAEAGLLLLGELGCVNCHQSDAASPIVAKPAPRLTGVGSRLQAGYLQTYLADPQLVKPGTTMPQQLRHPTLAAREDAASLLTHFLLSSTDDVSSRNRPQGDARRGQVLYHQVGCVACHQPEGGYRPASWGSDPGSARSTVASVPFGTLGEKYRPGRLARFLLDPLKTRPAARMPRTPLSEQEAADLEAYLSGDESAQPVSLQLDLEKAAQGRALFEEIGCASCHEMVAGGTEPKSNVRVKPLAELRGTAARGCLADSPPPGAPDFGLSDGQRKALRQSISSLAKGVPAQAPPDILQRNLTALNCLACHVRDGSGGPDTARAPYFETVEERDLGDEGRFPPALSGVGRKLTADALDRSIQGADPVRPYVATRMPDYGATHATVLAELFEQADLSDDIAPVERRGRNRYGRELVGQAGLGCVGCHDLQGRKSSGIGAIDLVHSPKRLRVEWFRDFLIDPARFSPGTRMPSFWPGGEAIDKKILRGHTARQIDSLWVYLLEIDQTRLPEGMEEKEAFELKPVDRPIVFRTFMAGVGMHAVAVGFSDKIHAAFDSQQIRWALAWRGRFLDAESTWDDRFTPLTPALSDDLVTLFPGPPFAIVADEGSPWPAAGGVPAGYRFGGFRLDEGGVPVFLYEFEGLRFEDRITPTQNGRSLRREVRLRGLGQDSRGGLWFRAGAGGEIEALADGSYRIDGRLRIRLEGVKPRIRRSRSRPDEASGIEERQELVAPVSVRDGQAVLVQEITW
jgi:mono/diheme cytochrome c family protein